MALLLSLVVAQLGFAALSASADGGDFQLDFASATPGTYDQSTGTGGTWDDVVQQLEGGDFACGDVVQHLTEIVVDDGATGTQAIEVTYSFDTETTSGGQVGYGDVTYASINIGDPNNQLSGNETVTLTSEQVVGEEIIATVEVTGLEAGEVLILSVGAQLVCNEDPDNVTGNIHATLESAQTSEGDTINTGNDDTPLISAGEIAQPGLEVTKSCPPEADVGETITYEITITNTGNETIDITSVVDTVLGDLTSSFPDTLGAGLSATEEFQHEVEATPDPLENTVTVEAVGDISGQAITDTASCITDVNQIPDIEVTKSCTPAAGVGDIVTYEITVTNTGTDVLNNIVVLDTVLGNLSGSFANSLDPGESETQEFEHEVSPDDPDPLRNFVLARGTGADSGDTVQDIATCVTDIANPGILVEKSCPTGAGVGDVVTYVITVTNTGDEILEDITVVDTILGDLSDSFDDTLDPEESQTVEFTHEVLPDDPDPLENIVTATGTGAISEDTVDSVANCLTDIGHPVILVEKSCPTGAGVGDTITYTITVTNLGDETLEGITVSDTVVGDLSGSFADALDPGASESHDFAHVVTAGDPDPLENTVTATGTGAISEDTVTSVANCVTDVIPPELPVTGADLGSGLPLLLAFLLSGVVFLFMGRRPRTAAARRSR